MSWSWNARRAMPVRVAVSLIAAAIALAGPLAAAGQDAEWSPARAVPLAIHQGTDITEGMVIQLRGTDHLWIADAHGLGHYGGDTLALAGHRIDWSRRVSLSAAEIARLPLGDPWLSSGLVKAGEPIYLPKHETNADVPYLLHIQSIRDVELFGITAINYGRFVVPKEEWEQRVGVRFEDLDRGELNAVELQGDGSARGASGGPVQVIVNVIQNVIQTIVGRTDSPPPAPLPPAPPPPVEPPAPPSGGTATPLPATPVVPPTPVASATGSPTTLPSTTATATAVPVGTIALRRYANPTTNDVWVTTRQPPSDYRLLETVGFLFTAAPADDALLLYDCSLEPVWPDRHMVGVRPDCENPAVTTLGVLGWVTSRPFPGAQALFRCFAPERHGHDVSLDPTCASRGSVEFRLGYLRAADTRTPPLPTTSPPATWTATPSPTATFSTARYPLAGQRYGAPQGDAYSAVWTPDRRLFQDRLPPGTLRIAHTVAITLVPGEYTLDGVECALRLDASRNGLGAGNPITVAFGNDLRFPVATADGAPAWALIECRGGAASGFQLRWLGPLRQPASPTPTLRPMVAATGERCWAGPDWDSPPAITVPQCVVLVFPVGGATTLRLVWSPDALNRAKEGERQTGLWPDEAEGPVLTATYPDGHTCAGKSVGLTAPGAYTLTVRPSGQSPLVVRQGPVRAKDNGPPPDCQ